MEKNTLKIAIDLILMNWHDRFRQWERVYMKGLTLVGSLWKLLRLHTGLFEQALFEQTGLPEQILVALTDFSGWTLIALTKLLDGALLTLTVLLGQTSLTHYLQ